MYRLDFTTEAGSQFRRLPEEVRWDFEDVFPWLERNPMRLPPWVNVVQLGMRRGKPFWRLRVGEYRAIYTFDGEVVKFTRFAPRRIVYNTQPKV